MLLDDAFNQIGSNFSICNPPLIGQLNIQQRLLFAHANTASLTNFHLDIITLNFFFQHLEHCLGSSGDATSPHPDYYPGSSLFLALDLLLLNTAQISHRLNLFHGNTLPVTLLIFFQELGNLVQGHATMGVIINHQHRSQATGADTCHWLQGKTQILGGFPRFDFQLLLDLVQNSLPSPNMTGSALANPNNITSPGLKMKLGIKSRHAVHLAERNFKAISNVA